MKYFALLTKLGENLLAQATALGTKLELTHMAVGDGGGSLPTPDTNQTKLIAEKRRAAINTLFIDDKNKNQIIAEQIIPEQDGGWWIREIGLFDKVGNLIAVANCPETYKPQLAEGSGRTQSIRIVLIVSHTESVTLKIDPSVVLATREYVNTEITVLDKKIDALSAQTKLDLNKKFDKANISGVKGNDNDKVPSLNLFTTEVSKLQPKGNYQPAGDYATNINLANGLALKFDKTGGTISGDVTVQKDGNALNIKQKTENQALYIEFRDEKNTRKSLIGFSDRGADLVISNSASGKTLLLSSDGKLKYGNVEVQSVPIGGSIIWNTSAPIPPNFWANEGRSFSASEYPELAKIFTNLTLPDDRGYGVRVADNGRGIDPGRVVGTYQEDAMQKIQGKIENANLSLFWSGNPTASGAFKRTMDEGKNANSGLVSEGGLRGLEFDSSLVARTANETRMKNVAKILITRVK
ncbi:phage tail protein [Providencia sp. Me1]|uniref:phage tail protein n=1 Tax=Providencia sp. Me1 TaxID=3392634 RepID=UPI003D2BFE37